MSGWFLMASRPGSNCIRKLHVSKIARRSIRTICLLDFVGACINRYAKKIIIMGILWNRLRIGQGPEPAVGDS